jgi:hypothetical protein
MDTPPGYANLLSGKTTTQCVTAFVALQVEHTVVSEVTNQTNWAQIANSKSRGEGLIFIQILTLIANLKNEGQVFVLSCGDVHQQVRCRNDWMVTVLEIHPSLSDGTASGGRHLERQQALKLSGRGR